MPPDLLKSFMKGEHVTCHTPCVWKGMWTDMMIETAFMRYGKGPNDINGITPKPNTRKTWALSLHTCSVLAKDICDMTSDDQHQHFHKEEMKARMESDAVDCKNIREKLQGSIDPLDPSPYSYGDLVHVVSGRITTDPTVNVHD